jgi:hypothetical protein
MSKTLVFKRPANLNRLAEDLFDLFPAWRVPFSDPIEGDTFLALASVSQTLDGQTIIIACPDETDEKALAQAVTAHNPAAPSRNEQAAALRASKRQALLQSIAATKDPDAQAALTALLDLLP